MLKWIDNATLEQLLAKWRFAPSGDPMFVGDIGKHFEDVMNRKRKEEPGRWISASKNIGW